MNYFVILCHRIAALERMFFAVRLARRHGPTPALFYRIMATVVIRAYVYAAPVIS